MICFVENAENSYLVCKKSFVDTGQKIPSWTPGHAYIICNEHADRLAKEAAQEAVGPGNGVLDSSLSAKKSLFNKRMCILIKIQSISDIVYAT